jgi:ABC-type Zn uptake system ZnuABC Zn-binding protein ZnuA
MKHRSLRILPIAILAGSCSLAPAAAKVRVVTTTTDLASLAREIGGDRVEVTAIAAGSQDPHFVDAKPSYLIKLQRADLFVEVGLDLEIGWAPTLLTNSRNARIQPGAPGYVDASAGIERLQVPTAADRTQGDIHPYGNPHYWLDPANGHRIAANIAAALERVDPDGAAGYRQRLADFDSRLDQALQRWTAEASSLAGVPVVAYHNSWPYFEKRFGFDVVAFVEPKPGIPPSGRYVAELAERMKKDGVKLILMSTFYDQKTAELVARLSGADIVTLANSVGGVEGADDYLELFDVNLSRLIAAIRH